MRLFVVLSLFRETFLNGSGQRASMKWKVLCVPHSFRVEYTVVAVTVSVAT